MAYRSNGRSRVWTFAGVGLDVREARTSTHCVRGAALVGLLFLAWVMDTPNRFDAPGLALLTAAVDGMTVVLALLGVAIGVAAETGGRASEEPDLLRLADDLRWRLRLNHFVVPAGGVAALSVAAVPLMLVCVPLGGVTLTDVVTATCVLASWGVFAAAVGCAVVSRFRWPGVSTMVATTALLILAGAVGGFMTPSLDGRPARAWVATLIFAVGSAAALRIAGPLESAPDKRNETRRRPSVRVRGDAHVWRGYELAGHRIGLLLVAEIAFIFGLGLSIMFGSAEFGMGLVGITLIIVVSAFVGATLLDNAGGDPIELLPGGLRRASRRTAAGSALVVAPGWCLLLIASLVSGQADRWSLLATWTLIWLSANAGKAASAAAAFRGFAVATSTAFGATAAFGCFLAGCIGWPSYQAWPRAGLLFARQASVWDTALAGVAVSVFPLATAGVAAATIRDHIVRSYATSTAPAGFVDRLRRS